MFGQHINTETLISSNEYFSDEKGNVLMQVNIIGHVKKPGTYIIYEGADFLTILSQAGGPLQGAKLNKVILFRNSSSEVSTIDLKGLLENGKNIDVEIKPNDTIYVSESFASILLSRSVTSILQILNILITILN